MPDFHNPHGPGPPAHLHSQGSAEGGSTTVGADGSVKVSAALTGWHDFNMAFARALPTSMLLAGRYQVATLRLLKARGKVRR